jgi:hypothetical protein
MNKKVKDKSAKTVVAERVRTASSDLPAEVARLLARLGEAGAYARPDPLVEDALVARRGGDGVSIGSGRFATASGQVLAAADLATWNAAGTQLTITAAGRPGAAAAAGHAGRHGFPGAAP